MKASGSLLSVPNIKVNPERISDSGLSQKAWFNDDTLRKPSSELLVINHVPVHRSICGCEKKNYHWKVPWIVITISLMQIFIYMFANGNLYEQLLYTPLKKTEIWRFLSYSLLHLNPVHLVINIFLQIVTGFALETEQGSLSVLAIYASGVLSGSLGTSIFHPDLLLVGASAGVYSLITSHIPHLVLNFSSLPYRYYRIVSVIVICLNDVCFTILRLMKGVDDESRISLAAHICGAINGFILGFAIFTKNKSCTLLRTCKYFCIILYISWISIAIIINQYIYIGNSADII